MATSAMIPIDPVVLGERLASARRVRGLTQQQAAEALGVTQTSIANMEEGDRMPQARELYALSRLYGRQLGDLIRTVRDDVNPALFAQCLTARAKEPSATEGESERHIQHCEDFGYWYTELEEMVGSSVDAGACPTLQDRFEVLAARAFAEALISEGQLARMLATDRISALQIVKERLRDT